MARSGEQLHRRVQMRQIVLGLRDLRLIRPDPAKYLGAFLCQSLDHQRFGHANIRTHAEP